MYVLITRVKKVQNFNETSLIWGNSSPLRNNVLDNFNNYGLWVVHRGKELVIGNVSPLRPVLSMW